MNQTSRHIHEAFIAILLLLPLTKLPAAPPSSGPIDIDTGRQLFVDDLLIEKTNLKRTFHAAEVQGDGPVLKPETPIELNTIRGKDAIPVAAPFGDGVWFDPKDNLFKMWYHAGWFDAVGYATSKDGLHWERPSLDVTPGTNRVLPVRMEKGHLLHRDAASIWLDDAGKDAAQRWKMFVYSRREGGSGPSNHGELFTSPDGIHWKTLRAVRFGGDNTSIFHDPFRNLWIVSIREMGPSPVNPKKKVRSRAYRASPDFTALGKDKSKGSPPLWLQLDKQDLPDPALGYEPQLYHFTATPYESLMVGVFGVFYGPPNEVCAKEKRPKIIDLQLGFSRDGLHYDRPNRTAFLKSARTPGAWNRGYLHTATGVCLIVGDKLRFYFGTWSGVAANGNDMYAGGSTGLATLRRDGFASMDADAQGGTLTTALVAFKGKWPFVNVAASGGELRAEILDAGGKVIEPFSLDKSAPVRTDSTHQRLEWQGGGDLSVLAGRPVRFRFHLSSAQLYSFWVSPAINGASNGYVAAGGPGFTGPRDTPDK